MYDQALSYNSPLAHVCQPSGTPKCVPALVTLGRRPVLVLDTPGFSDPRRRSIEILDEIARIVVLTHRVGVCLRGIIYIHGITDSRCKTGSTDTLEILKRICGDDALRSVMVVTSRWDRVEEDMGSRREAYLRKTFMPDLLSKGSTMGRFYGSRKCAVALVSQLLAKKPTSLRLQLEIVKAKKHVEETAAGRYIGPDPRDQRRDSERRPGSPPRQERIPGMFGRLAGRQSAAGDEGEGTRRLIVDEVDEVTAGEQMRAKMVQAMPHLITTAGFVVESILAVMGG